MSTNGTDGIGNRIGLDFDAIVNDNAGGTVANEDYQINLAAGVLLGYKVIFSVIFCLAAPGVHVCVCVNCEFYVLKA